MIKQIFALAFMYSLLALPALAEVEVIFWDEIKDIPPLSSEYLPIPAKTFKGALQNLSSELTAGGVQTQLVRDTVPGMLVRYALQVLPVKGARLNNIAKAVKKQSDTIILLDPKEFNVGFFSATQNKLVYRLTAKQILSGSGDAAILHELRHWGNFNLLINGKMHPGAKFLFVYPSNLDSGVVNYRDKYSIDELVTYTQQLRMELKSYFATPNATTMSFGIDEHIAILATLLGAAEGALNFVKDESKTLKVELLPDNPLGGKNGYASYVAKTSLIDIYFLSLANQTEEQLRNEFLSQTDKTLNGIRAAGPMYDEFINEFSQTVEKGQLTKAAQVRLLDRLSKIKSSFLQPLRSSAHKSCSALFN